MNSALSRNGRKVILVVDDDKEHRGVYEDILVEICENYGCEVMTACDGQEALAAFSRHMPNVVLVITDNDMPKMTGRQLVDELKRGGKTIPIIMISGDSEAGFLQWTRQAGLRAFLSKPVTYDRLVGAVEAVLAQP